MSAAGLLARAWALHHRGRAILTIAAIALACGLVVFTIGAYRAAIERSSGFASDLMGPYDVVLMPRFPIEPVIGPALETALRDDPQVAAVHRGAVVYGDIEDAADTTYYDSWRAAFIALDPAIHLPLAAGHWPTDQPDLIAGCVSGGLAKRWRITVGDRMPMLGPAGSHELLVVGITDEVLAHPEASGVFVAQQTLERLAGGTRITDRLAIALADGVDSAAFLQAWASRLDQVDPPVNARDLRAVVAELGADKSIANLRSMAGAASALVLVAAGFIVATSMATGAAERRRQLALLRCVGASRGQIVAAVLVESCWLGVLGCLAGLPLGWGLLQVLALAQADLFGGLIAPDLIGVLAALACALACALLAGIAPALAAGRVPPIEAMAAADPRPGRGPGWPRALIGLGCLGLALGAIAGTADGDLHLVATSTVAGLVCLALSALLLVPATLRLVEALIGPLLGRLTGLPADLLRHQAGPHLARAGGTVLTLAVCFGASVCMNVWGRSMVTPFMPSPELPAQVVSLLPGGAPPAAAAAVGQMPGVNGERVLPLRVEQLLLGGHLLAMTGGNPDETSIQIIGLEPEVLAQPDSLLPVASPQSGAALAGALSEPGACLVPPTFLQRFDLAIGDPLPLMGAGDVSQSVSLRIAGEATLPGWHWITKMGRMRSFGGKPTAPILVSMATAERLGVERIRHWLLDTTDDFDRATLRTALQAFAEEHAGAYASAHLGGGIAQRPSVKMIATGEVARRMRERSDAVIWVLGAIPLGSLLVAVLGVANAIAIGIRIRTWEFGILRAIGCEARQLARLVLGETVIVAVTAGGIGLVYGIATAWSGIGISIHAFGAGGSSPPLVLPWLDMVVAWLITLAACLIAIALPLRRLKRRQTLDLLQAGRAAT